MRPLNSIFRSFNLAPHFDFELKTMKKDVDNRYINHYAEKQVLVLALLIVLSQNYIYVAVTVNKSCLSLL